jgi:two-component system, cell cycle sensor histidine kinase and response regulator CckA
VPTGSPPPAGEKQPHPTSPASAVAGDLARDEKYRSFLALTNEGIWHAIAAPPIPVTLPVDEQVRLIFESGRLVECNDAMARMYGLSDQQQLAGTPLRELLLDSELQNREYLAAFVRSGYRLDGYESVERTVGGSRRIFLNSLIGIIREGQLVETWGSQTDITERKRLEVQARQTQALDAVSRLAGSVAHDFNNLLTTILTSVELLVEQFDAANPARQDAEEIRRSARRGAELTRQLLALSRQQVLAPRAVDVHALVRRIEGDIRNAFAATAKVDFTFGDGPGIAHIDVEELEQMLLHLATHAAEVIGERGAFLLDVRRERVAEARAALPDVVAPGDYVTISLRHTGVQIPSGSGASLLEPFAGAEIPSLGSGLALATMYGFVRQSGGAVVLEPCPAGVCLTIYFPATALPTPAMPGHLAANPGGQRTVLLAEDEPTVRLLMKRVLERAGYTVLQASTGEEALEVARAYGSTIDALVTDVIMPGMGGGELSRRLRQERPGIRVLHVSGYTAGALRHHDVIEAAASFLQKPFSPQTLLAKLREILV